MILNPENRLIIEVPSALEELAKVSEKVLQFFVPLRLGKTELFDVRLCFEESFINAVKYGNKNKRELPVKIELGYTKSELLVSVEDCGTGFKPEKLPDPTDNRHLQAPSGRGVYLIRHLMDRVSYNSRGNRVEMVKIIKQANEETVKCG